MNNNIAIKVENLSKRYRIGQYVGSGSQYKTLRESLTNAVSAPPVEKHFEIRSRTTRNPTASSGPSATSLLKLNVVKFWVSLVKTVQARAHY